MNIALINKIKILILNELSRRNTILKNNINSAIKNVEKIALNNKKNIENLVIPDNSSIEEIVNLAIAKIVSNAPEDLDTLKEIADYIESDKINAANINISIDSLTKTIQAEIDRAVAAEQDIESRLLFRNIKINESTGYLYIIYEAETPDEGDVPL